MTAARVEPGSFRDPHSRVFVTEDGVLRTLSYERGWFERCLGEAFDVQRSESLGSGTRLLYFAQPRG